MENPLNLDAVQRLGYAARGEEAIREFPHPKISRLAWVPEAVYREYLTWMTLADAKHLNLLPPIPELHGFLLA
jgi:hypothetical protein